MSKKLMMTKFVIAFGGKKYLLLDQNYVNHIKRKYPPHPHWKYKGLTQL